MRLALFVLVALCLANCAGKKHRIHSTDFPPSPESYEALSKEERQRLANKAPFTQFVQRSVEKFSATLSKSQVQTITSDNPNAAARFVGGFKFIPHLPALSKTCKDSELQLASKQIGKKVFLARAEPVTRLNAALDTYFEGEYAKRARDFVAGSPLSNQERVYVLAYIDGLLQNREQAPLDETNFYQQELYRTGVPEGQAEVVARHFLQVAPNCFSGSDVNSYGILLRYLEDAKKPGTVSTTVSPAPSLGISKKDSTHYIVNAQQFGMRFRLNDFLTSAQIKPYPDHEPVEGLVMNSIQIGSPWALLGLVNGDILTDLNELKLNHPDVGTEMAQIAQNSKELQLRLLRDHSPMTLRYTISP